MHFSHDSNSIFAIDKRTRFKYIKTVDERRGAGR